MFRLKKTVDDLFFSDIHNYREVLRSALGPSENYGLCPVVGYV